MRYILLFLLAVSVFFVSCSKEDKPTTQQNQQKVLNDENDNPADTNLTPEEKFSASILIDFLDDSDDEDLASFLETEVYKMGSNFNGASVVEITPSTWLVSLEKEGNVKNFLLQKYVDFKSNEYYFSMKETSLTLTDIISRSRPKTTAGE
jgi:hypothetical protein